MENRILIDRFAVKNYRSIKKCDVQLGPLTFLVGTNGSGKTSFVDAMLFVSSALSDSLQKATSNRGGIRSLLHRPEVLPRHLTFDFSISSNSGFRCKYLLELHVSDDWSVTVSREECRIEQSDGLQHSYLVKDGMVTGTAAIFPAVSTDRVFLSNASGLPEFRLIFEFLSGLRATEPATPTAHIFLQRWSTVSEGNTLARRFQTLIQHRPDRLQIIEDYLRAIAPPFEKVEVFEADNRLWLRFIEASSHGSAIPFHLSQSSAGLIHSADILLDLFEPPLPGRPASVVIIEEPEAFLHPGAIRVLLDSFNEASALCQVVVTTHSPELLDDQTVSEEWIRSVSRDDQGSHIDPLESSTKLIIQDRLYTPGQLLRQGGLH